MNLLKPISWLFGLFGVLMLIAVITLGLFLDDPYNNWTVGFGIAATASFVAFGYLGREGLKASAQSRSFRYSSVSFSLVLVVGMLAITGFILAKQHDTRWDLTSEKRFSISDKTVKVLEGIDRKVKIYAFFQTGSPEEQRFRELIEGYTQLQDQLTVRFADPIRNPSLADKFAVTSQYGTVVLESGDDRQRLERDFHEEAVTDALIRLLSGEEHLICWSTGHGEASAEDGRTPMGMGLIAKKMADQNYKIQPINLLADGVPPTCEAVVIANPRNELLPLERESLAVYLAQGGGVTVLLEPASVPLFAMELDRYGVEVGDDIVLDSSPANQAIGIEDPTVLLLRDGNMAAHPITEPLQSMLLLQTARSTKGATMAPGLRVHELLSGSRVSWGETSYEAIDDPAALGPTEGLDRIGRVPLAVAIEILDPETLDVGNPPALVLPEDEPSEEEGEGEPTDGEASEDDASSEDTAADAPDEEAAVPAMPGLGGLALDDVSAAVPDDFEAAPGGRLVVFGDADFATNPALGYGNNQDLFLNTIAWLVDEEDQISQGPEGEGDDLSLGLLELILLALVSVLFLPGAAIAAAVLLRVRRQFL